MIGDSQHANSFFCRLTGRGAWASLWKLRQNRCLNPFRLGAERGYVEKNPAEKVRNIRKQKGAPDANRPWSDQERHVVLDSCPAHMRSAIALMMFTGLSPKDALRLQRSRYQEGEIATRRSKTGEPVFWPAPAA